MKKNFKFYIACWAIIFAIFNVIVFVLRSKLASAENAFNGTFWIGWSITVLAFIGHLVCAWRAFKTEKINKVFLKLSIVKISYSSLITTLVVCGVLMAITAIPAWIAAIVGVVILGFYATSVLKASAAVEFVIKTDEKIKEKTHFIKSLTADAEILVSHAKSEEAKAEYQKVYEAVRYSDPMSSDALGSIESQITVAFGKLSDSVNANEIDKIKELANEVVILVGDRNKKCKLLK